MDTQGSTVSTLRSIVGINLESTVAYPKSTAKNPLLKT